MGARRASKRSRARAPVTQRWVCGCNSAGWCVWQHACGMGISSKASAVCHRVCMCMGRCWRTAAGNCAARIKQPLASLGFNSMAWRGSTHKPTLALLADAVSQGRMVGDGLEGDERHPGDDWPRAAKARGRGAGRLGARRGDAADVLSRVFWRALWAACWGALGRRRGRRRSGAGLGAVHPGEKLRLELDPNANASGRRRGRQGHWLGRVRHVV